MITYIIIFILLLIAELLYFRIADKFNIIDKPNERSSHSTIAWWRYNFLNWDMDLECLLRIPISLVLSRFDISSRH